MQFTTWLLILMMVLTACTMNKEDKQLPPQRPLQGPRAKNTPRWKRLATPVVTRRRAVEQQWGGAAKNERPGGNQPEAGSQLPVWRRKQTQLGPRAKNRRP
jgi:hypothetical protein